MMHYQKGENIEKQLNRDELPFVDFLSKDTDFLWMHVNGGTKVNNVITYAKNALDKGEHKHIVWSGNGGGVVKTISCAEILKRSYPLYQVTRMCYITVEEHWKPQMEGLDEIVANRKIPSIHIFMSLEPVDDNVKGLQKPNTTTDFWVYDNNQSTSSHKKNNNNSQRNTNQNQRRFNQHERPRQFQENKSNNNNEQNNDPSSSGSIQQRKSNNKPKRRKPNHQDRNNVQQTNRDKPSDIERMAS